MKYEHANQALHHALFLQLFPPLSSTIRDARTNDKRLSFSLLKCYDQVIERIYSSITLQSWLRKACGFYKEKVASQREREKEKERERENTSIELYRERFAGRLEQIFRDGGESKC